MKWIQFNDSEGKTSWLSADHVVRVIHDTTAGYFQIEASDGKTYLYDFRDKNVDNAKAALMQLLGGDWDSSE